MSAKPYKNNFKTITLEKGIGNNCCNKIKETRCGACAFASVGQSI